MQMTGGDPAPQKTELRCWRGQSCPPAVPASSRSGVSFFGSMNGFSTITAEVRFRGVSTSSLGAESPLEVLHHALLLQAENLTDKVHSRLGSTQMQMTGETRVTENGTPMLEETYAD